MNYTLTLTIILFILAAWFAWRYYNLRSKLDEYASRIRAENITNNVKDFENLSSAISSLVSTFDLQHSTLNSERARLATVLDQITDGVLIADAQGYIQFANPAVARLFQTADPINRSITEVIRSHQLVEAWRRCQQTREMQSETVEVPTRHQFLQLVVIPNSHSSGSLLLVQDLTHIRRLETVRRDFISNLSHELRTPLASLKALAENSSRWRLGRPARRASFY